MEKYNENREENEIDKVERKVPGWISKPNQICSIILNEYMALSNNGNKPVHKAQLQSACEEKGVTTFEGNYLQMRHFGLRNHAKVFEEKYGIVSLWPEVSTFIKRLYK